MAVQESSERDDTLSSMNVACSRSSSATSRDTRPRWSSRSAAYRSRCSSKSAESLTENSGRDRTSALCYAVGWTQHTVGVQFVRTAAILQLLLGNIGRPGGGILALRGHASIQGSTDIPTLYNLLPGYIPMPHAHRDEDLDAFIAGTATVKGYWGNMRAYLVSLLKAWWGPAATAENDFCFDYLPRLTGSHSTYDTVMAQMDGTCRGYFIWGENPAVGSANAKMQRLGMANLDWLVVRDFSLIESATFWKDGPEIESGELRTEDIAHRGLLFPAAAHTEKNGSFTNTQRMLQWHHAAIEPAGAARSDLWFAYHLGRIIRSKLAGSTDEMDRPLLDLTWDYPTEGSIAEPCGRGGPGRDQRSGRRPAAARFVRAAPRRRLHGLRLLDLLRRLRRRDQPGGPAQAWSGAELGGQRVGLGLAGQPAHPLQPGVGGSRRPPVERTQGPGVVGRSATASGPATTFLTLLRPRHRGTARRPMPAAAAALSGTDAFVMQADGKAWLFVPAGLDRRAATHPLRAPGLAGPEPALRPAAQPGATALRREAQPVPPRPFAIPVPRYFRTPITTYRLTEHHTAGGMSRWVPYLSELQPEMFCEVSPQLAEERGLEHLGWATIVTARNVIEARVLVTERIRPLVVHGRIIHQIGLPYHWGPNGYSVGDAANELASIALDPNVHIQEVKALSGDIRPGRRPRGPARLALVEEYIRRAGITEGTGMEVRGGQ